MARTGLSCKQIAEAGICGETSVNKQWVPYIRRVAQAYRAFPREVLTELEYWARLAEREEEAARETASEQELELDKRRLSGRVNRSELGHQPISSRGAC